MYRAPTPVSCVVYVALCWCISVFPLYFYICPSLCPLSLVSGSPFSEQVKNEGKRERPPWRQPTERRTTGEMRNEARYACVSAWPALFFSLFALRRGVRREKTNNTMGIRIVHTLMTPLESIRGPEQRMLIWHQQCHPRL